MNLSRAWFVLLKEEFVLYIQPSGYRSDFFITYHFCSYLAIFPCITGKKMIGEGAVDYLLLFVQVISVALISF